MRKPETPARETIAPSDLTFGLSTCKRCLWLKYWFKFELKKEFPLVKPLADSQEEHFRRAPMQSLHSSLKPGVVKQWGQWVKSAPISINGLKLAGRFSESTTYWDITKMALWESLIAKSLTPNETTAPSMPRNLSLMRTPSKILTRESLFPFQRWGYSSGS